MLSSFLRDLMLMTTMLALTHARKVLEKALLKRNTKTLTMVLESCTYQLWCLVSAQVKSFCIGGGAPADLQDRDEFKDEMKIIDAGLKEVAGIVDPVETPMRDGDDDGLGGDREELSLVMKPTWQNLALDGPLAEKEIAERALQKEQLQKLLRDLTPEERQVLVKYEKEARRLVRSKVALLVETDRKQNMIEELKLAIERAGGKAGDSSADIVIMYDQKTAGEAKTCPHIRHPPLQANRLKKAVTISLEALQVDHVPANVTFFIFDAGMLGNKGATCQCLFLF